MPYRIQKLFVVDKSTRKIISNAQNNCWLKIKLEKGKTDSIYGVNPAVRFADGEYVVIYTELCSCRFKRAREGKRIIVSLCDIEEAWTWKGGHYSASIRRPKKAGRRDNKNECAEQSVSVLAGESPAWAKVNHQPNT